MNAIELNETQQDAYNSLIDFINSDKNELLLIGYAGTGKTTLITKFINDIINNNLCRKIAIVAPTHKAVNVAKSKLFDISNNELSKRIIIMTIHRLLNYKNYVDSNGEKYFATSATDPNFAIYNLIVIDECSMLSNQIIHDISNQLSKKDNTKLKIIYVGDPAQLPPVNQRHTEIFKKDIDKICLDKIIRTSNNQIMELSKEHRKWIFGDKQNDIPKIFNYICDKITIYSIKNNETTTWLDKYIDVTENISIDEKNNIETYNNNIILTWTNKKCNKYNKYIRQHIFNKTDLDKYEIGEILIFNDFYKMIINEKVVSFYTSEQVKLYHISQSIFKPNKLRIKSSVILPPKITEIITEALSKINNIMCVDIGVFNLKIKKLSDIMTAISTNMNEDLIQSYDVIAIHPDFDKTYSDINDIFELTIHDLRNTCCTIINNIKNKNTNKAGLYSELDKKINIIWKSWLTEFIDRFSQLNYGYALTVHKSQGSTFKNVFIDIADILDNKNVDETSKCLYTAITRSSNTLELLI